MAKAPPQALSLACRCATVQVTLTVPGRRSGGRVTCYCTDCQTAARHFGPGDALLSPAGGSDLWQTTPDLIEITAGADRLAVMRLSPRGLFRWYASCCDTPLFNTLPRLGLAFVGVVLRPEGAERWQEAFGKPICYNATASARPGQGAPAKDKGVGRAAYGVFSRMAIAALSGRNRTSPFRAPDGSPAGPVSVISKEARAAARP